MKQLIHPITKEVATYDEIYGWFVSDGGGGFTTYSEEQIYAYGFTTFLVQPNEKSKGLRRDSPFHITQTPS